MVKQRRPAPTLQARLAGARTEGSGLRLSASEVRRLCDLFPELVQQGREDAGEADASDDGDPVEHCEGCGPTVPATKHDGDDVPLCDDCFDACDVAPKEPDNADSIGEGESW